MLSSPYLQGLENLALPCDSSGTGIEALLDPAVMFRLQQCNIASRIPDDLERRIQAARPNCYFTGALPF